MPTLFFMPWTKLVEPSQIGPISLLRYEQGVSPGRLGETAQESLDAIFGNYADRAFVSDPESTATVKEALILRWSGDDEREDFLTDQEIEERLQQVQLLIFAALSHRQFGSHSGYCNSDCLHVIAQNFTRDNPAATAITTRRRDGHSNNYVAGGRGKPLFMRPIHVLTRYSLDVDTKFATALLDVQDEALRSRLLDSITLFNRANTDASEVPPSVEIVLMRAALETLLDVGHRTAELKRKLVEVLSPYLGAVNSQNFPIAHKTWLDRWAKQPCLFSAWVEDFCDSRNNAAHGKGGVRQHPDPVWSISNHLLFTSWLMSRLVKVLLAKHCRYELTQDDREELEQIELFFCYDLVSLDDNGRMHWHEVLECMQHRKLGRLLSQLTADGSTAAK